MDRISHGCEKFATDSLPYVSGLKRLIPEQRLAAILTRTARSSARRRSLPADYVIWMVIAMALFAADSIPKVWRRLHPTRDEPEPTDSAFSQARRRLSVAPLRRLFLETARPMATHETVGASYRGFHLMGLDGTVLDLPDTPENARIFGRPKTGRAEGAFPQVRLLALCELGTHAICGLTIKPICHGEQSMVGPLFEQLRPGMLLIWDGRFAMSALDEAVSPLPHLAAKPLRPMALFRESKRHFVVLGADGPRSQAANAPDFTSVDSIASSRLRPDEPAIERQLSLVRCSLRVCRRPA
jgi:Insertion element 4 transposase N-terminal